MNIHRHRGMSWAAFTVVLSALLSAGAVGAEEESPWIPIAEDGTWILRDGRQVDLSAGWRVVEHFDSGVQRVLPKAQGFGTVDWTMENVSAWDFEGQTHAVTWGTLNNRRAGFDATSRFMAPLQVASGLRVRKIELDACDTTQEGEIRVWLERCPVSVGTCDAPLAEVGTDMFLAPGCGLFEVFPDTTIDNLNYSYRLRLHDVSEANAFATRFFGVRVFLQRQVSPPPMIATFADVPPSHPFFQYIEALAASGISGGCDDPFEFCPDAVLTRAQIAELLAKALGLHWSP